MKIVKKFQPKIVIFTAVKNRCMLHGRVFVMKHTLVSQTAHEIWGINSEGAKNAYNKIMYAKNNQFKMYYVGNSKTRRQTL